VIGYRQPHGEIQARVRLQSTQCRNEEPWELPRAQDGPGRFVPTTPSTCLNAERGRAKGAVSLIEETGREHGAVALHTKHSSDNAVERTVRAQGWYEFNVYSRYGQRVSIVNGRPAA
jgi:hypothetical protein